MRVCDSPLSFQIKISSFFFVCSSRVKLKLWKNGLKNTNTTTTEKSQRCTQSWQLEKFCSFGIVISVLLKSWRISSGEVWHLKTANEEKKCAKNQLDRLCVCSFGSVLFSSVLFWSMFTSSVPINCEKKNRSCWKASIFWVAFPKWATVALSSAIKSSEIRTHTHTHGQKTHTLF